MNEIEKEQVNDMLDTLEGYVPPVEEPPKVDTPAETPPPADDTPPPPPAEVPPTDGEKVDTETPPVSETPAETPPPPVETPPPPPPAPAPSITDDRIKALEEQNKKLLEQVMVLTEALQGKPTPPPESVLPPKPSEPSVTPPVATPTEVKQDIYPLIKNEDEFTEMFKSHEKFNEVITSAMNKAVNTVLLSIPQTVVKLVEQEIGMKELVNEFYRVNEDLKPHAKFATYVANELAAANPDWNVGKVFEETGKEVRKRLGLSEIARMKTPPPSEENTPPPAFAPKGPAGRRPETPSKLTGIEKEVAETIF